MAPRTYDIVLYGATGFTGSLVCRHIAQSYTGGTTNLKWAMAGRDRKKLEAVREQITRINPACQSVPLIIADAFDDQALGKMMQQTKVVISTSGPYSLWGDKIVEQALAHGSDYVDITGEVPWVKQSIEKHHEQAKEKGVKIVHCCGFDSIPSDLGSLMVVDYIKRKSGKDTEKIYGLLGDCKGWFSGGTIASASAIISNSPVSTLKELGTNAYYLCQQGSTGPATVTPMSFYVKEDGQWASMGLMEGVNARIVMRSAQLLNWSGDFSYWEGQKTGPGWSGWLGSKVGTWVLLLAGAIIALKPLQQLLSALFPSLIPKQGQGPSEEMMTGGYFNHHLVGVPKGGGPGDVVKGLVADPHRDPGYWSTSRMVLEAGLCLALDADKVKPGGGVLTSASGIGLPLIDRLRNAGYIFEIEEDKKAD